MDIKEIQSQGVIVKLAYGGEEWGNTDAEAKVLISLFLFFKVLILHNPSRFSRKNISRHEQWDVSNFDHSQACIPGDFVENRHG